jgi:cytochrome P450
MFALKILFDTAFGHVDQDTTKQLHDDLALWGDGLVGLAPWRIPGTPFARAYDARVRLLKTIDRLIERFKVEVPPDSDRSQKTMMGHICYAKDEDGNPLSMDCLKDNILLMAFAGHDTTYMSLGTAIMYLAKYPAIQEAIS